MEIIEIILWAFRPPNPSGCYQPLATNGPAPLILDAGHNISPRVDKQLVLELYIGVEGFEVIESFPCRSISRKAVPLDQQLPMAAAQLSAHDLLRGR